MDYATVMGKWNIFFKNTNFIGLAGMTGENAFCVSWAPCGIVALTKKNKINLWWLHLRAENDFYICNTVQITFGITRGEPVVL